MEKIIVTLPLNPAQKSLLDAAAGQETILYIPAAHLTGDNLADATVVIGNVPPSRLAGAQKLRWVQLNSAGTDGYTEKGVLPSGCLLTNATGAYGLAISEYMLAGLLLLMKKLDRYQENRRAHRWQDEGPVTSVWGSRALIYGLGDIGGQFARRLHALGAQVTGVRRTAGDLPDYAQAVYTMDSLPDIVGQMDIVAACLPGTEQTKGIFNRAFFDRMKQGAYFINVGRGPAVVTGDLVQALQSGHLGGAVLDVTDPEPLPLGSPLWDCPGLVLTPHVSGGFHLPETLQRIVQISADNLRAYLSGEQLRNQVDFSTGYRKR